MTDQIILADGSLIPLADYQKLHNLPPDKIGEFFSIGEYHIGRFRPFIYSELLWQVSDEYRRLLGRLVIIGAAFRTEEYQATLGTNPDLLAAKTSPHPRGMADDYDTKTWKETKECVEIYKQAAKNLGIQVRIGYKIYWNKKKQTFFHGDVCPMYFAPGMPYHHHPHPIQWEKSMIF